MISITVEAVDAEALREQLYLLLDMTPPIRREQSDEQDKPSPEKPKATRSTKAKTEPAKQDTPSDGPSNGEEASSEAGPTATSDASPSDEPLDPVEVKKRGFRYAQKAGPQAAIEIITQAGAENGKFEELDGDGLARLSAALDELGY